jgi:hypothetical protein
MTSQKPLVIQQGSTVNPVGAPTLVGPVVPATPTPHGQFEDLTRKLVQVSKAEIDEKRKTA